MASLAQTNTLPETQGSTSAITVEPLTLRIGAEIRGVDATKPIPENQAQELRDLLNKWKVIFFRDANIDRDQQYVFAEAFGPIMRDYEIFSTPSYPGLQIVKATYGGVNKWHSDTSWMVKPAKAAVLRAVTIPPYGGDTMWADGVAAYEALSPEMKERIEDLDCLHDVSRVGVDYGKTSPDYEARKQRMRDARKIHARVAHPIVRTHPETGEKSLFLNANLSTYIPGLSLEESASLLKELLDHYARPEFCVRFKWTAGAIAVWDQRQTQHYAVNDYPVGIDRQLERILIASDDVPHR